MNEREHKTADQIEREIHGTEADIERTIDLLQHKLSPGAVVDTLLRASRENGAEFATNFGRSVRDNPLPITLIGTGLAWLMLSGRSNGRDHQRMIGYSAHHDDESYPEREDANRIQRAGVYSAHSGSGEGYGAAHDRAAEAVRSARVEPDTSGARRTTEQAMGGHSERADEYESTTSATSGAAAAARRAEERARDAAHTAQERARSLGDRAGESVHGARSRAQETYSSARSRAEETYSGARSRAEEAYSGARSTVDRAYSGTRAAGEQATERMQAGGEAAYRRGSEMAHRTTARASETASAIGASLREHPLAAGAILAGIGALVGALLPVTRREDALMGEHSDAVKAKARHAAEHEAERVRDVAVAAAEGARREAEARGLTPEAMAENAEQEVRRVSEGGKEVARAAMREGEAAAKGEKSRDDEERSKDKQSEDKRSREKESQEQRSKEKPDEQQSDAKAKPGGHVYPRMQAAPSPAPVVPPATPGPQPGVTPPGTATDPLKRDK
jgi:hypothetical protein